MRNERSGRISIKKKQGEQRIEGYEADEMRRKIGDGDVAKRRNIKQRNSEIRKTQKERTIHQTIFSSFNTTSRLITFSFLVRNGSSLQVRRDYI